MITCLLKVVGNIIIGDYVSIISSVSCTFISGVVMYSCLFSVLFLSIGSVRIHHLFLFWFVFSVDLLLLCFANFCIVALLFIFITNSLSFQSLVFWCPFLNPADVARFQFSIFQRNFTISVAFYGKFAAIWW